MLLETGLEKRRRVFSLWIIYFTSFIQAIGFSIVLTGVWPYLQQLEKEPQKELLGWVIAANPIGQLIFSPLIGWLCTFFRSIRLPSVFCLLLFILSNLWYALLPLHDTNAQYFMILARIIGGLSAGIITPCRTFVTQETLLRERTPSVAYITLGQVVGFMVGPAIQVALIKLGPDGISIGGVTLSMYTGTGWVAVLLGLLNLVLFHPKLLSESHIAAKEYGFTSTAEETEDVNWSKLRPDYTALSVMVFCFFSVLFNFSLVESVGMPMIMDQLGLGEAEAIRSFGITMTVSSALSTCVFYSVGFVAKRFDERKLLIFAGFVPTIIGRMFFSPFPGPVAPLKRFGCFLSVQNESALSYSEDANYCEAHGLTWTTVQPGCPTEQEWCFSLPALRSYPVLIGYFIGVLGFPLSYSIPQALYSKILGPRPQGMWNGLLGMVACLSKIVGSILLAYIYQNYGTWVTVWVPTGVLSISLSLVVGYYRRLVPFRLPQSSPEIMALRN